MKEEDLQENLPYKYRKEPIAPQKGQAGTSPVLIRTGNATRTIRLCSDIIVLSRRIW
ncbi:MAG: hypothetical protein LLG06_07165 [Desulfobacteraceae bacterium]|nr:hypothetical protein [Desulfobacteraceae bacterium]